MEHGGMEAESVRKEWLRAKKMTSGKKKRGGGTVLRGGTVFFFVCAFWVWRAAQPLSRCALREGEP